MNYPWGHNRRFNAYSNYFKQTFGERVQKVTIDAGFTCPNRDGTKGRGGCTYCNNDAFNPSYCTPDKSVTQQINEGIEFHEKRYRRSNKFLAYFQAYSNTYAPLDKLKIIYDEALSVPGIAGLVIGTRPDCIDEEKLEYFQQLSEKYYIILEYGIESCNNETLKRINRGHTFEEAVEALEKTKKFGIKTGAHFIIGLPGETKEYILSQAKTISSLPLDTIKFHQLQIIKGTAMEKEYIKHPENFTFFELSEYIDFFIRFIERLNPYFVVERFAGEVPPRFLAGPGWELIRNDQILVRFEKKLKELDTWQGKFFGK
ncbi:MAG TPA: TIGR01212 family radical SAM protein [Bacteroidales bacterium]|nr:TIGR01212 family radical SAM protein [Bacteroidales bacterium]